MNADVTYRRYDAGAARGIVDDLVAVYNEVYADADADFFNEDRYRRQLGSHMTAAGWSLATAHEAGELVGYIYGFPLAPTTGWWRGLIPPVPEGFSHEDGHRTFAISEILVRAPWRRRGIAGTLHDQILAGRSEERATLLVEADNAAARAAYHAWGWQFAARLRPSWAHAPLYDVLVHTRR